MRLEVGHYRHPWDCEACDALSTDDTLDAMRQTPADFRQSWSEQIATLDARALPSLRSDWSVR